VKAIIEVECKNPEIVIKSLKPEIDDSIKFDVKAESVNDKLILTVESENISGLLAGINSYMRLIRVAKDGMEELNE
jgi:tRNA threonylcarbamoyladenosine modification (KEOPS) complex  Pcc1 subunit